MNKILLSGLLLCFFSHLSPSMAANAHWLDRAEESASILMQKVMNKTETARDYLDETADEREDVYNSLNSGTKKIYNKSKQYIEENKDKWGEQYNSTKSRVRQGFKESEQYVKDHKGEWRAAYERARDKMKAFVSDFLKIWIE